MINVAEAATISEVANNLIFTASIVTNILHAAALMIGIGFIIYAFVTFNVHRMNPKMMPLDRPVIYLVLGLVLLTIPFLDQLLRHDTGESHVHKHRHQHQHQHETQHSGYYGDHDIDEPLE